MLHAKSAVNWTHGTPAGLPSGMPGMGEEMDGAMQQAPQPGRQACGDIAGVVMGTGERMLPLYPNTTVKVGLDGGLVGTSTDKIPMRIACTDRVGLRSNQG